MFFDSYKIKNYNIKNRAIMAPMCMYQADELGYINDFHVTHYATRAMGGVGLIIQEATATEPNGRISINDIGIWDDKHVEGLKKIVDAVHHHDALIGIQLNHAGRKARVEHPVGPSAISMASDQKTPKELTQEDINEIIKKFSDAAQRADQAGYDLLEIHAAHGYLIYQFLSPLSNQRTDRYQDGVLFLEEIISAISEVWPKQKLLAIRISATEYHPSGIDVHKAAKIINRVKSLGIDLIDISSGGNALVNIPIYPGYQLKLSQYMKEHTGLPTIGGGLITDLKMSEFALQSHMADFIFYGRVLLREPYFILTHASEIKQEPQWHKAYERGVK